MDSARSNEQLSNSPPIEVALGSRVDPAAADALWRILFGSDPPEPHDDVTPDPTPTPRDL